MARRKSLNTSKVIKDFESCKRKGLSYKKALKCAAEKNNTSMKILVARIFGSR